MGRFAECQGPGAVWGDGDGATSAKGYGPCHHFFNDRMLGTTFNSQWGAYPVEAAIGLGMRQLGDFEVCGQ